MEQHREEFIKHGRKCNSSSSVYERGYQARKRSQFVLFRVREGLSSTEGIAIRSLPYPERGSPSTEGIVICELPCTRRGYQAGKESQFVLFRIREGFSSTEGITNRSLSYPRGALKHGRDHNRSLSVSEKDSQPGKYFSSVHGFRPTHCFTRHTKSTYFTVLTPQSFVNRRVSISYLQKFESKFINSISSCRIIR